MTREGIIERLENIAEHAIHEKGENPFILSLDDGIAVHEAIEIIKAEPCEDAISRQAVNEIINDIRDCISVEGYCAILERLKKLPPVNPLSKDYNTIYYTPQPKTGHWIEIAQYSDGNHKIECSECGSHIFDRGHANSFNVKNKYKYCPNCGAKMIEPQETETWNGIHAQITAPKGTFERIFNEADDDSDI